MYFLQTQWCKNKITFHRNGTIAIFRMLHNFTGKWDMDVIFGTGSASWLYFCFLLCSFCGLCCCGATIYLIFIWFLSDFFYMTFVSLQWTLNTWKRLVTVNQSFSNFWFRTLSVILLPTEIQHMVQFARIMKKFRNILYYFLSQPNLFLISESFAFSTL